jgi:hypothetical protein
MEILAVGSSGEPTNEVLASTTISHSAMPDFTSTVTGNFGSETAPYVAGGERYALSLRSADATIKKGWWSYDGNPCPDGSFYQEGQEGGFRVVGGWDATFAIYVARQPPANDYLDAARVITGSVTLVPGTTAAATRQLGEPDHYTSGPDSGWQGDHTVWYRWTAPASGSTTIDTCQANIDSVLAVYTGSELGALSRVADNNNDHTYCPSDSWGSKVTFDARAGTTYNIAVGDAGGVRENTFTLRLRDIGAPTVTKVMPAPGRTDVSPKANIFASFSEAMDASSIDGSTLTLVRRGATTPVPASASYDAPNRRAILNPDRQLRAGATYVATVTTGTRDVAGNALAKSKVWSFRVRR